MTLPGNLKHIAFSWMVAALLSLSLNAQENENRLLKIELVAKNRVNEIAAMLPNDPHGFGDPISIRLRWDSLYATGKFKRLIAEADTISSLPFPKITEEIYMSYFGGRDSETSKRFIMKRRMLLTRMVWAECLTNKGKYLPAIFTALTDILNTRTLTFPAEDRKKTNYDGRIYTIGLSSAAYGSDIAQSLYLLRSKLPDATQQQLRDALQQRVFGPTLNAIRNKNANEEFISLLDSGNHNSVTLAFIAISALAVIKDKQQRAMFAAIAERYSRNFLLGYLDDGRSSVIEKPFAIRDYFEQAGVLTVRPAPGSVLNMGATFKGGNNAEHHNHNDLGSYTIVAGNELLTGDAGLATYTPKYFGKERYALFKTTASYGHNVPLVAGTQQHAGKDAHADIVTASFSDSKDVFVMDLRSAYAVPGIKKLARSFIYDRNSQGHITVLDNYSFDGEGDFETAIITRHKWKKLTDSTIEIKGIKERLKVLITTSGGSFTITDEVIDEGPKPYTRIAIRLIRPVSNGFVNMKFELLYWHLSTDNK